jgi:hypothetical protein
MHFNKVHLEHSLMILLYCETIAGYKLLLNKLYILSIELSRSISTKKALNYTLKAALL